MTTLEHIVYIVGCLTMLLVLSKLAAIQFHF